MTNKKVYKALSSLIVFLFLLIYQYHNGDIKVFTHHIQKNTALLNCISNSVEESKNIFKVYDVVDGDTLDLLEDCKPVRIRLKGIDTPETVDPRKPTQCFGKEASNEAKQLLKGQKVTLQYDVDTEKYDKYGRTLGYIILPNGTNFNDFMIQQGFAREYTYGSEHYEFQKQFKIDQETAKTSGRGLWATSTCNGTI